MTPRQALISLATALVFALASPPAAFSADPKPVAGVQSFVISETEISILQKQALEGSGSAAYRLAQYYSFVALDREQALRWMTVSAENGDTAGFYGLGFLLSRNTDEPSRLRARYWLKKAEKEAEEPISSLATNRLREF